MVYLEEVDQRLHRKVVKDVPEIDEAETVVTVRQLLGRIVNMPAADWRFSSLRRRALTSLESYLPIMKLEGIPHRNLGVI